MKHSAPRNTEEGPWQTPTKDRPTITLQELMVSAFAMTDALSKLLIEKGIITDEGFKKKLGEERATYQAILKSIEQ